MSFSNSDQEKSFTNLYVYLHNIRWTNLHSYINIKTKVMDHFQLCFVFIAYVLHVSIGCLLSVIFIGSVLLRWDYLMIMFIAFAMDENNHTLPIAFGNGVTNNFLIWLKEAHKEDMEVSFLTIMDDAFLDSYHGIILSLSSCICEQELVEIDNWNICTSMHANHILCLIFNKHSVN
uniref:Uncharacterized protein n=1 Tax=Lactuca sativa TaxID=4236 RepID=A0A9R1WP06_LACSA|nr:hypothetical protein LSAT_V11C900498940 [Lactuca sativa]